ncbi:MAG: TetR/AcrR family transcriptional regulator, partial [Actinomycetota bacterium]|nr:TetR/AcrR family transcriptional regulator [Actinomycetota bacterium]
MSSGGRPQTRARILEAARAMFEEFGYHDAGLGAVAKRAGVSRQAIYLHFPSKAELLTALHQH